MATAPSIAWRRLIARRASRPSDEVVDRGASPLAFSFTPVSFLQSLQAPESRNRAPGTATPFAVSRTSNPLDCFPREPLAHVLQQFVHHSRLIVEECICYLKNTPVEPRCHHSAGAVSKITEPGSDMLIEECPLVGKRPSGRRNIPVPQIRCSPVAKLGL